MAGKRIQTKDLTLTAVMTALICVAGPLSISIGPIPISLASFAVYLAGAILGPRRGTLAVALYLVIGMIGVPVFSGFGAGFQKLAGVTGGYLIGYLPCAFLTGIGAERMDRSPLGKWLLPVMMAAGTVVLYALGTVWFILQTGNGLAAALSLCVLPFLIGDAIKIVAASLQCPPIRKAVYSGKAV